MLRFLLFSHYIYQSSFASLSRFPNQFRWINWSRTFVLTELFKILLYFSASCILFFLFFWHCCFVLPDFSLAAAFFHGLKFFFLNGQTQKLIKLLLRTEDIVRISWHQLCNHIMAFLLKVQSHSVVTSEIVSMSNRLVTCSYLDVRFSIKLYIAV